MLTFLILFFNLLVGVVKCNLCIFKKADRVGVGARFSTYKGPGECGRKVLISLRLDSATSRDEGTAAGLKGNVSPLNTNIES